MQTHLNCQSIFVGAQQRAEEHRWNCSVQAQRDLGPAAVREWYQIYFPKYVRGCFIEHICGASKYVELAPKSFSAMNTYARHIPTLAERIVAMLREGKENLDVIQWAMDTNENMEKVIEFLEVVDVNACRFPCPALNEPADA